MPTLFTQFVSWVRQQQKIRGLLRKYRRSLKRGRYVIDRKLAYSSSYTPAPSLLQRYGSSSLRAPALLLAGVRDAAEYECLASATGGVLLFGGVTNTVKRIISEPLFDDEYVAIRKRFSRHLSAPTFKVDASRQALVEQQVHGVCLDELDEAQQLDIVKGLLRRLASLCFQEKHSDSKQFLHQALSALNPSLLPADLLPWLQVLRSSMLVADVPLVPSHGDLLPKNVLVNGDDTWIIDWDSRFVGFRPCLS